MSPHNFLVNLILFCLNFYNICIFSMICLLSLKYQNENRIQFLSCFDWRRHSFLYLFPSNITLPRMFSSGLVGDFLKLWIVYPIASVPWQSVDIFYSWKHFPSARPQNESCAVGRRLSMVFQNFCFVTGNPQKLINYASLFQFANFKNSSSFMRVIRSAGGILVA